MLLASSASTPFTTNWYSALKYHCRAACIFCVKYELREPTEVCARVTFDARTGLRYAPKSW
jgi:hypothetical protein